MPDYDFKKIKKILILFFFLIFTANVSNASLLWDINFGIAEYKKSNFKVARDYFLDYIKSNPNNEEGYYWLAKSYFGLNDNKNANVNFKKAHELTIKEKNIEKLKFDNNNVSNIEDYFDMAVMYFESRDLKNAEFYADLMLKVNPKSPSAYFIKAKIEQLQGNNEKAVEHINKAIIFNNKLIKTNLARNLNITKIPEMTLEMYEMFALEAYFSPDTTSAIRYCRRYLESNPSNKDIANMLIDLYIKNNEYALAQEMIDDIIAKKEANIPTLLLQARIYEYTNDEKLEQVLLDAYKINPNNLKTLLELGNYYLKKQDFISAKKYFETLISVNDAYYEGYFGYIYSLCELNLTQQAVELIRKFIALNPDSSEGYYLLSKICEKNGDFIEANEFLSQAIEKAKNPHYYLKKAEISYILKNYQDSIDELKIALDLPIKQEMKEEINELLVKNYLKTNDLMNAQILLNKNNALDKSTIVYKYNLYTLYKKQGNEQRAEEQFSEVKKAKLNTIKDYIDWSEIYYDEEEFDESLKILNKGVKKFPQSHLLFSQQIKIYSLLNKKNEIKPILEKTNNNY